MVITGDHVLSAKIHENSNGTALIRFNKCGVPLRDVMRSGSGREQQSQDNNGGGYKHCASDPLLGPKSESGIQHG